MSEKQADLSAILKQYRCRFTVERDDEMSGLPLEDKLCPPEATDITEGRLELEALADFIGGELDTRHESLLAILRDLRDDVKFYLHVEKEAAVGAHPSSMVRERLDISISKADEILGGADNDNTKL